MTAKRQFVELALPPPLLAVAGTAVWLLAFAQSDLTPEAPLLLLCLPVVWWLGRPWVFTSRPAGGGGWLVAAGCAAAAGCVCASVTLLTLAWTLLLGAWLRRWLAPACFRSRARLLALASGAFPWLLVDGNWLGWMFRSTGVAAAVLLECFPGMHVKWEGAILSVKGASIPPDAAGVGLQSLQVLLCVGLFALFRTRGPSARLIGPLAFLVVLAWLANILRILAVALLVLTFGHDAVNGIGTDLGGLVALVLMFWVATLVFDRAGFLCRNDRPAKGLTSPR